jgi:hypothetical protein
MFKIKLENLDGHPQAYPYRIDPQRFKDREVFIIGIGQAAYDLGLSPEQTK